MNKSIYVSPKTIERLWALEAMPSRALRVLVDDFWNRLEGKEQPLEKVLEELKVDGRVISNRERAATRKIPMPYDYEIGQRVQDGDRRGVVEGVYAISGTIAVKWFGSDHVEVVIPQNREVVPITRA